MKGNEPIMTELSKTALVDRIIEKAVEFGADLAGTAAVKSLKASPSHWVNPRIPAYSGVGTREGGKLQGGAGAEWPEGAASAVVIAMSHPEDAPELDWWDGLKGTPGNRQLMRINKKLSEWLRAEMGMQTWPLPYHVEKGGIFLKDAAVAAGIGVVGRNNLLVTYRFGPQVRLRCLLVDADLPATGPAAVDPCDDCPAPCRDACPQDAFAERVYTDETLGPHLPGRDGHYSRQRCNQRMEADIEKAEPMPATEDREAYKLIKYCRACELACIAGL